MPGCPKLGYEYQKEGGFVMEPEKYQIKDGPSKFALMESLFCGDSSRRQTVDFTNEHGCITRGVVINTISRESGSGEDWIFKGWWPQGKIEGYYCSRTRKGHMTLVHSN